MPSGRCRKSAYCAACWLENWPSRCKAAAKFKGVFVMLQPLLKWVGKTAPDALRVAYRIGRGPQAALARCERNRTFVQRQFRQHTGHTLNLDDPRTISDKLNAMKLMPPTPLQVRCADKLAVRDYVADLCGPDILPRLIVSGRSLSIVSPGTIAEPAFVIKTNHGWGGVHVCLDRDAVDWSALRVELARQLSYNHWHRHREPVYRSIVPAILCEEYLPPPSGERGLVEYKYWCFHGTPRAIMVITENKDGERTKTMVDMGWERLRCQRRGAFVAQGPIEPPAEANDLAGMAETLSEPFAFCRVDFFRSAIGMTFSEITFFPHGGIATFDPPECEERLGRWLHLEPIGRARLRRLHSDTTGRATG